MLVPNGAEECREIPNLGEDMLANLDDDGIIRIGAESWLAIFWLLRSLLRVRLL